MILLNVDNRYKLIEELHATHTDIVKMKSLARSYFWWRKLDKELQNKVRECESCQLHQKSPTCVPIHSWEFPSEQWSRIHIDFAEGEGKNVLVLVDAHSKCIETRVMNNITARNTVKAMCNIFRTMVFQIQWFQIMELILCHRNSFSS